jgi:hypothetical protein
MTAAAAVSWEVEACALLTNPVKVADAAALSTHLAELGFTAASELLEVSAADIAEIAAFLRKIPQSRLLKINNDAAAKA